VLTLSVKPRESLWLWCGAVGAPAPRVTWTRHSGAPVRSKHNHTLIIDPFTPEDEVGVEISFIKMYFKAIFYLIIERYIIPYYIY
jgi:hypothetical protein